MALLEVDNLVKHYSLPKRDSWFDRLSNRAVDGVSFNLQEGRTLGVVGESGCGKSSLARTLLRLQEPGAGTVRFMEQDWLALKPEDLRRRRIHMQMVFQDPQASLNPRMRVGNAVTEPLAIHFGLKGEARDDKALELLEKVGIPGSALTRFPHEFSGGQRQRLGIARAVATAPKLLVADEPVSSLDISIQAQILNLLKDLQKESGMALIFVAHDLRVVEHMSDEVAVMYLGRFVEKAPAPELYQGPRHPYTQALINSIPPAPSENRQPARPVKGDPPSPTHPPSGCHFHPRCPMAREICRRVEPEYRELVKNHWVACHLAEP